MKKPYYPLPLALLAAYFLLMAAASCNKEKQNAGETPLPSWILTFLLTDSTGKHLLPVPLAADTPFNPKDFSAYNSRNESIGWWREGKTQDTAQILFQASEKQYDIINDPLFQSDSCFVWYFCFANQCDTLVIYPGQFLKRDIYGGTYPNEGEAEKIIWGKDTFYNYKGSILRIYKEF